MLMKAYYTGIKLNCFYVYMKIIPYQFYLYGIIFDFSVCTFVNNLILVYSSNTANNKFKNKKRSECLWQK